MLHSLARKVVPQRLQPSNYLRALAQRRANCRVFSGPFKGMMWLANNECDELFDIPKLLGIYERELYWVIERVCELDFASIVDVGAAEGYYAVGLAVQNPGASVIAFEMQQTERERLVGKAQLNKVLERVEIRGKCEPHDLENVLTHLQSPLVIVDTEGYESKLLDPHVVPSLGSAYILVELHEFAVPGVSAKIKSWYGETHSLNEIWHEDRQASEFPFKDIYTSLLPSSYFRWAVGESRPSRMSWLWMEPK